MKIVSIVGARPQFIKAAAVSRVLRGTAGVTEVLIHTGQHYDDNMSAVFFEELEIPEPDYHLGVGSGSHGIQTGRMLEAMLLPLHSRTRQALDREGLLSEAEAALCIIPPVGYLDMVLLEKNARLVATDSGGVQKEAYFYRVPCVTLREETEWVELVDMGWNIVVPPLSIQRMTEGITVALQSSGGKDVDLYGNGNSAEKISKALTDKV